MKFASNEMTMTITLGVWTLAECVPKVRGNRSGNRDWDERQRRLIAWSLQPRLS